MDAGTPRAALAALDPELHVVSGESLHQASLVGSQVYCHAERGAIAGTIQSAGAVEYFLSKVRT
jgi:hypothetical protein